MNYQEWTLCEKSPIYLQLYQKIQKGILYGELSLGENLPTIREMASMLRINPNTVSRAYRMVCEDRLILLERRKSYKVTDDVSLIQKERDKEVQAVCCNYICQMSTLGFSKEEAVLLISGKLSASPEGVSDSSAAQRTYTS